MNHEMMKRRGRLNLSYRFVRENPDLVLLLMKQIVVIEADNSFFDGDIEYRFISPNIREVKEGEGVPEYRAIIDKELMVCTLEEVR